MTEEERRAKVSRIIRGEEEFNAAPQITAPTLFLNEEGEEISARELSHGENYGKPTETKENPIIPDSIMEAVEAQAKSLPIFRNLLGTEEKDEQRAYEVGKAMGLNPQALLDNPELDREATTAYERQKTRDFLQGKPFSPQTLKDLYPEVDTEDTVAASIALRNYNDLRETRSIVNGSWDVGAFLGLYKDSRPTDAETQKIFRSNSVLEAWEAGSRDFQASQIMEDHMKGKLSDEAAEEKIKAIYAGEEDFQNRRRGIFNIIKDDTIRNVSNMAQVTLDGMREIVNEVGPVAAPMLRQLSQYVAPVGTVIGGTLVSVSPAAAGAVMSTAGAVSAAGISALSLFVGSYKQQRAQNYWDMMQKRDSGGKRIYTKEEAAKRASTQAFWQAGLETVGAEFIIGRPVAKVFGGDISKAIIGNTMARNAIATAGRNVIRKETAKAAGKQFAAGAALELAEEGMQQAVSDIDETIYGRDAKSAGTIFWNAVEAMAEAAPAVIGMTIPGAGLRGVGTYRGYRSLQKMGMKDAVEEFKRENEKDMVHKLVEQRGENKIYKNSPETYAKTVQAQFAQSGKETMYVDAASAAATEAGRNALTELVTNKVVSAEEVENAVQNGSPLEIKPGVYMQEVSEQTAEVIAEHSTFDKGGRTLDAIKKSRQRLRDIMSKWEATKADREAAAVDAFVDEILPSLKKGEISVLGEEEENKAVAARERERSMLKEILAEDVSDPIGAVKRAEAAVKKEWYEMIGDTQERVDYLYNHHNTVELIPDYGSVQYHNIRVSSNEGWYSALYKKLGKKPTIRDVEYATWQEAYDEAYHAGEEDVMREFEELKKRREAIESIRGIIEGLDRNDLSARTSLSKEAYEMIYKSALATLEEGNVDTGKTAKDAAYILAKQADLAHELYGQSYEDAAKIVLGDQAVADGYRQDIQIIPGKELSNEASEIIKQEIKNFKTEDFVPDKIDLNIYMEISKETKKEIFNGTLEIVRKYVNEDLEDPLGNKVRFERSKNETIEEYVLHLIAGHEEQWDETSRSRALGVRLVAQTIQNPMAIILQENGRRAYLSLYSDGMNRLHQVVVGVQEDEGGRIVTSFVKDAKKRDKNAPVSRFKNQIAASKKVLYVRGLNDRQGLSGHSRPQVVQWASKLSAALHPSGNSIVTQTVGNGNIFEQPAWHGSPYTFDKFSMDAIGSGEGAQAHGWGLYFAADKEVSEVYKNLQAKNYTFDGKRYYGNGWTFYDEQNNPIPSESPLDLILRYTKMYSSGDNVSKETAIRYFEREIKEHEESLLHYQSIKAGKIEGSEGDRMYLDENIDYCERTIRGCRGAIKLVAEKELPANNSRLYEADIPESDVMLDEQKSYSKQPEKVKENLSRAIKELNKERKEKGLAPIRPGNASGRNLYNALSEALGGDKEASLFLNEHGIKGITYKGGRDGRCFVVFDDKAISILNVYQQEQEGMYAGQYSEAENLIKVFRYANASTVMHESAHAWLSMLFRVLNAEAAKRGIEGTIEDKISALYHDKTVSRNMIEDLAQIVEWGRYTPKALEEYKGTILESEFMCHAADIENGVPGAEIRFIQERFARAFEKYLMTGKAPSKDLRGPFRRFKTWLTEIYREIKNLGQEELPEDITTIFDHMLATQEEIDAWAAEKKLMQRSTPIDFSKTELENIQAWAEEIKEKAKEKCMAMLMHRIESDMIKNFEDTLPTFREECKKQLIAENPIYQMELTRTLHPTEKDWKNYLEQNGYTEETYERAVQNAGGKIELRLDRMVDMARSEYRRNLLTPEMIRGFAESELQGPSGQQELIEIEAAAMNKRINQYIRASSASLMEVERTKDVSKKLAYEIKKRNGLTTAEEDAAYEKEQELEKAKAEKGALRERAHNAEVEKAKLKQALRERIEGLKKTRQVLEWNVRDLRLDAEQRLSQETVSKATNWKWWDNKAKQTSFRVRDAIDKGDFIRAAVEKKNEARYSMMARVAHENEQKLKKILRGDPKTADPNDKEGMIKYGVLGILNRIGRKEKPVLMQEQARYFCQHFAYQLGLLTKDGVTPTDEKGNPVPFSWISLARELNPTQALSAEAVGGIYDGADVIAPWIRGIFENENKTLVETLSFEKCLDAMDAIRAAYKIGRREYEGNTLILDGKQVSFDEAAQNLILSKWTGKIKVPYFDKQRETGVQRTQKKVEKAVVELTLPEILWERLGDAFYQLFYQTIDRAANIEREMLEAAGKDIKKTIDIYSRKEWQAIRNDKKYQLGYDENGRPVNYTKETVLIAALNWGSGANRARLTETLRVTRDEAEDFIYQNMTDKDWDFVEAVWKHINSYYPARNRVQDHLYGVPLGKVDAYTFTIPSGRVIHGDYYPIKYDSETAAVSAERAANEIAQQGMMGVSTFGLGMGSTKQRARASGGQNLRLDLEVYLEHVGEAVHHIAMREASVDVYKLISRQDVTENIIERVGVDTYNTLKQWVADQWHSPIDRMTNFERLLTRLRRHMTFASMAFRASTAILNIANIFPVMEKMGAKNALYAIGDYYHGNVRTKREFVMEKSSFMRGRQTNLDRDFMREKKFPVGKHTVKGVAMAQGALEEVNKFGYWSIVETDFMLSLPQWLATYKKTMAELLTKERKMTIEEIDAEAVRRADKAVRETFGSGEIKDQSAVMKSKFLGQITPFYSYTALVMNQFIRAGYIKSDTGNISALIRATFYWWILGAIAESAIRQAMAAASGDDKEEYWQRLIYSFAGGGPIGGIPIARDIVPWMAAKAMGIYKGDGKSEISALAIADDAMQVWNDIMTKDPSWLKIGRDTTRVLNRAVGASDTLTDGFWNLLRLLNEDTNKSAMEIIASIILDKDIQKRGAKK